MRQGGLPTSLQVQSLAAEAKKSREKRDKSGTVNKAAGGAGITD
jgi:hypothetical protein